MLQPGIVKTQDYPRHTESPSALPAHPHSASVAESAALADQLAESRAALHAENMSSLEIDILAAMWNHHPRPLLVSEIYLAIRSSSADALSPCATAVTRLAGIGLLTCSGAPSFHYQLTRQGIFAAFYLAISGISDKFNVAEVNVAQASDEPATDKCTCGTAAPGCEDSSTSRARPTSAPSPEPQEPSHCNHEKCSLSGLERSDINEAEACHAGCGRIATAACDCGNAVCSTHRYNADGQHDPAGVCSTCYEDIAMER